MLISLNNLNIQSFKDATKFFSMVVKSAKKGYELAVSYNPIKHEIGASSFYKRSTKKNVNYMPYVHFSVENYKTFTEMDYYRCVKDVKSLIRLHNIQEDF